MPGPLHWSSVQELKIATAMGGGEEDNFMAAGALEIQRRMIASIKNISDSF